MFLHDMINDGLDLLHQASDVEKLGPVQWHISFRRSAKEGGLIVSCFGHPEAEGLKQLWGNGPDMATAIQRAQTACREVAKPPLSKFQKFSRAVELFHGGDPWNAAMSEEWKALTGVEEVTTKTLCDFARRLKEEDHGEW